MTTRKPPGEGWESFVERQIREAQERGEFDDLEGAGKPIPDLHRPRDELWWVRKKLKAENLSYIPPTLQIRKELEEARAQIERATSEQQVRRIVSDINERIRIANREALHGPASTVGRLDEEKTVREWRERHG